MLKTDILYNGIFLENFKVFEKMLPKETLNVKVLKINYGFYLNRIIEEYQRIDASDEYKDLIYSEFYRGYPNKPFISNL